MAIIGLEESPHNRVIFAAAELYAQKGYQYTSQREISQRSGVTTGSLYCLFPGKRDILDTLIKLTMLNLDAFRPSENEWDEIIEKGSLDDVIAKIVYSFPEENAIFLTRLLRIFIMNSFTLPDICRLYHEYFIANQRDYLVKLIKKLVAAKMIQPLDELRTAISINDAINYRAVASVMFPDLESYLHYALTYGNKDIMDFRKTVKLWLATGDALKIGITQNGKSNE